MHIQAQFLSLFKAMGGVRYLEGGIESGFNHVEPDKYEPRLLHIKGRRNVRAKQAALTFSSLNEGDVFVLDKGLTIFVWNGAKANQAERSKGVQVAVQLRNERGARPTVVIMDEDPDNEEFWSTLGGRGVIASEEEGGDDDAADSGAETRLFRISDASGSLEVRGRARVRRQRRGGDQSRRATPTAGAASRGGGAWGRADDGGCEGGRQAAAHDARRE